MRCIKELSEVELRHMLGREVHTPDGPGMLLGCMENDDVIMVQLYDGAITMEYWIDVVEFEE